MKIYKRKIKNHKITNEYKQFSKTAENEDHRIDFITSLIENAQVKILDHQREYTGIKRNFLETNWKDVLIKEFNFEIIPDIKNNHRLLLKHDDLNTVFEYALGSIYLNVFDNKKDYKEHLRKREIFCRQT